MCRRKGSSILRTSKIRLHVCVVAGTQICAAGIIQMTFAVARLLYSEKKKTVDK